MDLGGTPSAGSGSVPLPRDAQEGYDNWKQAVECYTHDSAPPHAPKTYEEYSKLVPFMARTAVYYYPTDALAHVQAYASCRWPCAMGATVLTDRSEFKQRFPWMSQQPLYRLQTSGRPVQMGVLTVAPTYATDEEVHVFHMIAPDLGEADFATLDQAYFNSFDDTEYELAKWHARNWYLAFRAAQELGLSYVAMSKPGGGAFWPRALGDPEETFVPRVFKVAMALLEGARADFGITMVEPPFFPQGDAAHRRVTASLRGDVLYVNAWCHSSFVGNGNRQDHTLDGGWGRVGALAPMAWPPSNPFLGYKQVVPPDLPPTRPKDRQFARRLPVVQSLGDDGPPAKRTKVR